MPMPMAGPSTAAMSGLRWSTSCIRKRKTGLSSPAGGFAMKSPRSLPAVNDPPEPSSRTTRTAASSSATASCSVSAAYIALVNAFFFSARASVRTRTAPSVRARMCGFDMPRR